MNLQSSTGALEPDYGYGMKRAFVKLCRVYSVVKEALFSTQIEGGIG